MTIDELKQLLYEKNYPKTLNVDAFTYANVCQSVFDYLAKKEEAQYADPDFSMFLISIGSHNNGIMFKNVEIILDVCM